MEIHVVVHSLVGDGGRVLLLRRAGHAEIYPGMWDVPGGLLELAEDPEAGARRELLEETGLRVGELTPHAVSSNMDRQKNSQFVTIFFRADFAGGTVRLASAEHSEFCWLATDEALDLPLVPLLRQVLAGEPWAERQAETGF